MMTIHGVIRGKMIELEREPGWPEGEQVAVTIERAVPPQAKAKQAAIPAVELWADRLVFDSAVMPVERMVKGTELAAERLVKELELGRSDEEMLQAHRELTHEDLSALRYYAQTPVGIRRSFGGWAEEADELDDFMDWNRQRRKRSRREVGQ
jgi:uncharacterized protein (DUF433 family)